MIQRDNNIDTEIHNVHSDGKAASVVCCTEPNTELTRKRNKKENPGNPTKIVMESMKAVWHVSTVCW